MARRAAEDRSSCPLQRTKAYQVEFPYILALKNHIRTLVVERETRSRPSLNYVDEPNRETGGGRGGVNSDLNALVGELEKEENSDLLALINQKMKGRQQQHGPRPGQNNKTPGLRMRAVR